MASDTVVTSHFQTPSAPFGRKQRGKNKNHIGSNCTALGVISAFASGERHDTYASTVAPDSPTAPNNTLEKKEPASVWDEHDRTLAPLIEAAHPTLPTHWHRDAAKIKMAPANRVLVQWPVNSAQKKARPPSWTTTAMI